MDILIGTRNAYKKGEMIWFLGKNLKLNIHSLDELSINVKVEENESSLIKNAKKKAKEFSKLTDYYVLASDGGINIPGLGNKWDILKNQRTVGENNSDLVKAKFLLNLMKDLKGEERKVIYHLALALAKNGKVIWSKEEITDKGFIAKDLIDNNIPKYRWMGHIWYYPKHKKVFNQLNKNELADVRKEGKKLQISLQKQLEKII
ncbi:hypothetical protein KJ570_01655 [Patescibacteria group bacterium]|nr:hypothetical protein [Patescibacteria group bacterium]MBU2036243.1 hypothetical protein [Patescibacteria group bacterium]